MNFTEKAVSKTIQNRIVSDQELVIRLQRGNEWAFQLLVRRFRKKLFSIAFGITLDAQESQDIVQEVFLQVYRRIHSFRGDASLSTWLHRITVNQCLNWKRRWARRFRWMHVPFGNVEDGGVEEPASPLPTPEGHLSEAETGKAIDDALKKLPEHARAVFVLREIEGLSYEEIAAVTGAKLGTVRSRLFNARKRLKELLMPSGKDES